MSEDDIAEVLYGLKCQNFKACSFSQDAVPCGDNVNDLIYGCCQ